MYSNTQMLLPSGLLQFVAMDCTPFRLMTTTSPGRMSRTSVAPMESKAQDSLATT